MENENTYYSNRKYWLYLAKIRNMESGRKRFLLDMFGSPEEIFKASEKLLRMCPRLEEQHIAQLIETRNTDFELEMEELEHREIGFITWEDDNYPEKLRYIPDAPCYLFYKGSMPPEDIPAVAIVGSRKCSFYGREVCMDFSRKLAAAGIEIISGMAAGIDGFAHRGALDVGGSTFAVVGSGVDVCYPTQNRDIYRAISEKKTADMDKKDMGPDGMTQVCGIISEYYPGTAPLPINFPQRNRIISGLADVLLVVEARMRSGTSITVDHALEQGRDVFAIPGRIGDTISDGCNELIKNGARLASSPEDIIEELKQHYEMLLMVEKKKRGIRKADLTAEEKKIIGYLSQQPVYMNELAIKTGISCEKLSGFLVDLELKDVVEEVGKNVYIRKL